MLQCQLAGQANVPPHGGTREETKLQSPRASASRLAPVVPPPQATSSSSDFCHSSSPSPWPRNGMRVSGR